MVNIESTSIGFLNNILLFFNWYSKVSFYHQLVYTDMKTVINKLLYYFLIKPRLDYLLWKMTSGIKLSRKEYKQTDRLARLEGQLVSP